MTWLNPTYFWALALVPLAIGLFIYAVWQRNKSFALFGESALIERLTVTTSNRRRRWKSAVISLVILGMVITLAGPRFGTKLSEGKREGVDLIIALDVSLSMQAEDVLPNRLAKAKHEISNLIGSLNGDRIGLVLFAGDAFIQCPLTLDYSAIRIFLDVADPDLIPTQGTDFQTALTAAVSAFEAAAGDGSAENTGQQRTRALVFVSDGENHVAEIENIISEAEEHDIALFAAGVGELQGVPIPVFQQGRRVGYKKDREGNGVTTRLEEAALQALAADYSYFHIGRTVSNLQELVDALNQLEKTEFSAEMFEEYQEQYQWPLALVLILLVIEWMVSEYRLKDENELTLRKEEKTV